MHILMVLLRQGLEQRKRWDEPEWATIGRHHRDCRDTVLMGKGCGVLLVDVWAHHRPILADEGRQRGLIGRIQHVLQASGAGIVPFVVENEHGIDGIEAHLVKKRTGTGGRKYRAEHRHAGDRKVGRGLGAHVGDVFTHEIFCP